jgi:two-component system phosphate regulon sensor histidine kinase PhoR
LGTQTLLKDLKKTVYQMSTMISHILDFEKSKDGGFENPNLKIENIKELLLETVSNMEPLASEKAIALTCDISDEELPVKCDRVGLAQVFTNLIDNSIKYSAKNERISIEMKTQGSELRLKISDHGRGIDPKHLPHIFEKYWQAPENRNLGTGLGLAIVKGILEAHGGSISVESRLNFGTTFTCTLPLVEKTS